MKILLKLLTQLSFKSSQRFGLFIGYMFILFGGKSKSITKQNINLCFPNLSKKEKKILMQKSLLELGKLIIESFFIWGNDFKTNNKYIENITGIELLNKKQPTILLTPHFGSFEIIGGILSLHRPLTVLYKKAKNKILDEFILNARNKDNLSVVPITSTGIVTLARVLKHNGMIGILPDQHPGTGNGIIVNFLGVETKTTTLLAKLANKYQAKVILTYAIRGDNGYNLFLEEVDISDNNINKSVAKMNKIIENLVKKFPERYIWNYKKFKETYDYK